MLFNGATHEALFTEARTQNGWTPDPINDELLVTLYNLVKMGPTSANCSPGRFVFLRTSEAKERLRPALSAGNLEKTMAAPVVVIIAYDPEFYKKMAQLFPHVDARSWFTSSAALAEETAFRNSTLQGAYMILASRLLGLGTGPMSGFDKGMVNDIFFSQTGFKTNFLLNIGHGMPTKVLPRLPRLEFAEACTLL